MMGRAVRLDAIAKSILNGVDDAFTKYEAMSGGHWLNNAPESFIQSSIALSLTELQEGREKLYITLEASPRRILNDIEIEIDYSVINMRLNQKFDIMLWWKQGAPRAAIEIKKCWDTGRCSTDLIRMRQWLSGERPILQAGYMVVYSSAKAQKTLDDRFSRIAKKAKAVNWMSLRRGIVDDEGWLWDAACIILRP